MENTNKFMIRELANRFHDQSQYKMKLSCHFWWQVWPLQQQLIGTAKLVNQPILSFPQRHPSLPWVDPVFLQHHQDIPPDPPKVFHQIDTPHPRSDCHGIQWMFRLCRICSGKWLGLLVSSVSHVRTCETWNYVEYSSPLAYSKFYSSDT